VHKLQIDNFFLLLITFGKFSFFFLKSVDMGSFKRWYFHNNTLKNSASANLLFLLKLNQVELNAINEKQ